MIDYQYIQFACCNIFKNFMLVNTFIVTGTLWWSHHIISGLAQDQANLAALDIKLKHTPVTVHFKGKDYARVIPGSETRFALNDGSDVPGRCAQVWHVR